MHPWPPTGTRLPHWLRLAVFCLLPGGIYPAAPAPAADAWAKDAFMVLCYHDVRDEFRQRPDYYTVETQQLVRQFAWLRERGYHVVSLGEVLAARREHRPLPERVVVLTFDDGLHSTYSHVFPLLKAFHYPAVVGLVGAWLEPPASGQSAPYLVAEHLTREDFLSAPEIREMQDSGLVEFGSHTYDLHVGIPANPQGNVEPAAVARRFDASLGAYEDAGSYADRIREDLAQSGRGIERLTRAAPRVVIWPYGAHNHVTERIARDLGMPNGFTLEPGLNTPDIPLDQMRRTVISHDFTIADLARVLTEAPTYAPLRVMQVDLDFVYDADPAQQEANLSLLLERVKAMGVNTVFLQAFADPAGTGTAGALYFPNRRLPMRADLFNRVAWQLHTRTGVAVYAWMPLLAFDLPEGDPAHDHWVVSLQPAARGQVRRLSPFDPLVRQAVHDIYEDLSTYAAFQGLLFSDDATLSDFEDASEPALAVYRQWGMPGDPAAIRADARFAAQWSERKIQFLTQFSLQIADLVKADHDGLRTARNLFAGSVGKGAARQWLGQSLSDALSAYDYVALMSMPYLEGKRGDADRWLAGLVAAVAREPAGLPKTVFELQSVDWARENQPVSGQTLAAQVAVLRRAGARNFGYYPDDFRNGRPSLYALRPVLSRKSLPGND